MVVDVGHEDEEAGVVACQYRPCPGLLGLSIGTGVYGGGVPMSLTRGALSFD